MGEDLDNRRVKNSDKTTTIPYLQRGNVCKQLPKETPKLKNVTWLQDRLQSSAQPLQRG